MTLKDCIQEIINTHFVSENYFDSHTVINMLLQKPEYHLCYLKEFHEHYANCNVSQFHGHIATDMIKTTPNVESAGISVHTLNIYGGQPTKNELWKIKRN